MSSASLKLFLLFGLLALSLVAGEKADQVHVAKDGVDSEDCIKGDTPCLTVDYAVQNSDNDYAPVIITVEDSQIINVSNYNIYNREYITILGKGDVVFECAVGSSFGFTLKLKWAFAGVNITGIKLKGCESFFFSEFAEVVFQDSIIRDGGPVTISAIWLVIDNCLLTNVTTFGQPVIYNYISAISIPLDAHDLTQPYMIIRNTQIVGNIGHSASCSQECPTGNGMFSIDLPFTMEGNITILIENCNFTDNIMSGVPAPLLSTDHSYDSVFLNLTIADSNFINNSIPLTVLLTSTSGHVHINVNNSYFQNSTTPLGGQGLQIIQSIDSFTSSIKDSNNTIHTRVHGTTFESSVSEASKTGSREKKNYRARNVQKYVQRAGY